MLEMFTLATASTAWARAMTLPDACLFVPLGVLLAVLVIEVFAGGRKGVDLEKAVVVLLVAASVLFFIGGFLVFSRSSADLGREAAIKAGGVGVLLGLGSAVGAMLKQQCYLQKLLAMARTRNRRQSVQNAYLWPMFYFVVLLALLGAGGGVAWWRPDVEALMVEKDRAPVEVAMAEPAVVSPSSIAQATSELPAADPLEAMNPESMVQPELAALEGEGEGVAEELGEIALAEELPNVGEAMEEPLPEGEEESMEVAAAKEMKEDTISRGASAGSEPERAATLALRLDPAALRIFRGSVVPMMKDRCVSCHGPDKQKGQLRLDSPEWIRKGGSSGPVVQPFQPDKSYVYTSTILPADDPDIMPAKGKPLTSAQTSALARWIKGGAPMGDGKDRQAAQVAAAELKRGGGSDAAAAQEGLARDVTEALAAAHIQYKPTGDGLFEIDCSLTRNYPDVELDLTLLNPIANKIHTLDLSKTKVRDDDLKPVAGMSNLRRLLLSRTTVGDDAMRHFSGLNNLEILNLYGTNVSDDGLSHLTDLRALKKLYLWNSKATSKGGDRLKSSLPKLEVNVGQ